MRQNEFSEWNILSSLEWLVFIELTADILATALNTVTKSTSVSISPLLVETVAVALVDWWFWWPFLECSSATFPTNPLKAVVHLSKSPSYQL